MVWFIVLILLGLLLLFIEIFLVPGVTFVGIAGGILICIGILLTYSHNGATAGSISLIGSIILATAMIFIGAKSNLWHGLSNQQAITSRTNTFELDEIKAGDKGTTVSDLKPSGKAIFKEKIVEVSSVGSYIENGKIIEVIKISGNRIMVKEIEDDDNT